MTEFVGVDPHRLRILADRLKTLADAIARNGGVIRGNFNKWGGTLNLSLLMQQAAQVGDDARMMARRADAALNLLAQPETLLNFLNHPGSTDFLPPVRPESLGVNEVNDTSVLRPLKINIPWDVKDINSALEAKQEAATLQKVLQDPLDNRDAITQIAQSLADHQGDSAYMTAFMGSNGLADIVAVANALHTEGTGDGVVLNQQSQALLAQFGQAAQTMSQLAIQRKHPNYLTQLTDPPKKNLWSAAMLFKYGPSGDKWDPNILAAMIRTVLDAHHAGTLQVPLPDSEKIHIPVGTEVAYEQKVRSQQLLAEFDPACAVVDRAAQNGFAARQVLGGPNGEHYAQDLINTSWHTPGDFYQPFTTGRAAFEVPPVKINSVDLSPHVASFLQAATSAQFGASGDAKLSATALANIVQATAKLNPDKSDEVLPKSIRESFLKITDAHIADLAWSAMQGFGDAPELINGAWLSMLNKSEVNLFLRQAAHDPGDAGRLKGIFDAKISVAVGQQIQDGQQWLESMGHLYGMLQTVIGQNKFSAEEAKSAASAERQMVMSILTTGLTAFPAAEGVAQTVTEISNPLLNVSSTVTQGQFSGGDPAAALQRNDQDFINDKTWVQVPVVQGLIDAGQIKPPPRVSWYRNGHVVANADFAAWVGEHRAVKDGKAIYVYAGESFNDWLDAATKAVGYEQ